MNSLQKHLMAPKYLGISCLKFYLNTLVSVSEQKPRQHYGTISDVRVHIVIFSVQQAIAANSFLTPPTTITSGDVETAFTESDHVITGEIHLGGQVHFYMETQVSLAVPNGEDGQMEVFVSTQDANAVQVWRQFDLSCYI